MAAALWPYRIWQVSLLAWGLGACDTATGSRSSAASPVAPSRPDDVKASRTRDATSTNVVGVRKSASTTRLAPAGEPEAGPPRGNELPSGTRIVAFGDVHGDRAAALAALRLAGAVDADESWSGGTMVVVQTGDQLDRGDDERGILDLFGRLEVEARTAGGAFHVLNGNHELMNALGDFRYVTPGGFGAFEEFAPASERVDEPWGRWPPAQRGRAVALTPGGPYAKRLAEHNLTVIVGSTVFVHGGIRPEFADDLDELNQGARAWLSGTLANPRPIVERLMDPRGLVWSRDFSEPVLAPEACELLGETLARLKVKRMVVGHTVQTSGITAACDERVWRIDVGMAEHYGGRLQVLEIDADVVRVRPNHHGPSTAVNPAL